MDSKVFLQNNICRACLSDASSYKSLLSTMDADNRTVFEVLSFITNNNISIKDNLPKQVCNDCFVTICKADEFIKMCIQSENLLKNELFNSTLESGKTEKLFYTTFDIAKSSGEDQKPNYLNYSNKFDDLNVIKEEHDEFLQEDMEDLAENIVIENNQLHDTSSTDSACTDQFELESNLKECTRLYKQYNSSIVKKELTDTENQEINRKPILICPVCDEVFEYCTLYALHLKTHKKKAKVKHKKLKKITNLTIPLSCIECNENFPDMTSLKKHLCNHNEIKNQKETSKLQCSMCMRHFGRKISLIAHIKKHKEKAKTKFSCKACKREFQHQAHLDNHIVLIHSKEKGNYFNNNILIIISLIKIVVA